MKIKDLVMEKASLEIAQDEQSAAHQLNLLKEENELLKRQTHEMETFLNDYGLVWVGFRAGDAEQGGSANLGLPATKNALPSGQESKMFSLQSTQVLDSPKQPSQHLPPPQSQQSHKQQQLIYFDMKKMKEAVADLNSLVEEGETKVVQENGVYKFKQGGENINLQIYKDGMFYQNGPLRPYAMPEARAFIKDLLEGYFPYELKDTYPDGVWIVLEDFSKHMYAEVAKKGAVESNFHAFSGQGNRVGGEKVSAESFLKKLPKNVVSNGKVIDVRGSVGNMLASSSNQNPNKNGNTGSSQVRLVETPSLQLLRNADGRPQTPRDITTLRIKMDDGFPSLLMKMRFGDTIGTALMLIAKERKSEGPFELRSAFPVRGYSEKNETLQDAGLIPNASLFIRST